jgi:dTDP-4-amino-4,6-dideoxygalactose transaminase
MSNHHNLNHGNEIPFLDLVTPHTQLKDQLTEVFHQAITTAGFIGGPMVEGFEKAFAEFCDTRFCVGVASGTDALRFALMAAGVGRGDVAVTVPNTFIATTEAISQSGADPKFVDVDERTFNMDPDKLLEYLEQQCVIDRATGYAITKDSGKRVAAVVPVHLYGQPADMDAILEIAERFHLVVIEDACQAHGAEYFSRRENRWRKVGSMGHAAAFSFYPGKNLGACGEGGAITTNDEKLAQEIRMLRDHGQAKKYYHAIEGYNGRLDAIQAGILKVKLAHLADWNEQRRQAAERYADLFSESPDTANAPFEPEWSRAVYHLYVIRCKNRTQLKDHLASLGIGTGIHYPIPLHLQDAYKNLGYREGDFPVSEQIAGELLSLPMFPTLTAEQQRRVVSKVIQFALLAAV